MRAPLITALLLPALLFSFFGGTLEGCVWCTAGAPLAALEPLQDDARFELKRSALLAGASAQVTCEPIPLCLNQGLAGQQEPLSDRFYGEYLLVYFPKADVIIERLFPTMCPDAVQRSLASLTFLLTHTPWRYFVNNQEDICFESVHVGIIEEQLTKIITALPAFSMNVFTGCVVRSAGDIFDGMPLLRFWQQKKSMESYATLIALCLDTMIHRLYRFIKEEDFAAAYRLNKEVQSLAQRLRGTRYEEQYAQSVRLFVDLLKMLEQRLWDEKELSFEVCMPAQVQPPLFSREALGAAVGHHRFLDSFVQHYEANVTGKFTHEYHPAILEETAASFTKLEQKLSSSGLSIVGRLTLMGYEEQGITRYKTKYTDAYLSDEMAQRTSAGVSLKMFNRFGLLTGFLCKDVAALGLRTGSPLPVTHVDADQVEIFDGLGTIFQEHAFSEAYRPTLAAYSRCKKHLLAGRLSSFFAECMDFWELLYSYELKGTGKQHVVGTQDILFSIAYMRYLRQSTVPVFHFYLGPDITYPIETSLLHNREATRHAQSFVKTFTKQLKPIEGKKTAYVFCSFVDGVGKSTMLGNVENAMKHGNAIESYEHVDNSSSQLATVFKYAPDVLIADLPAQVSHFTYKPDGFVYVDCGALLDAGELARVQQYVAQNRASLEKSFHALLADSRERAYDLTAAEKESPEISFALNLHLLDKAKSNTWVSFCFEDKYYLFDGEDVTAVRLRVPLATAPSHGLKNSRTEQMIFTTGVRFPLSYDYFLNDLVAKLRNSGAENVVMVDFVSMYSRSSRENIRVNYVIQQLALLYKDFSVEKSFYQDFVHNAQLLVALDQPGAEETFGTSLHRESLVRLALYDLLFEQAATTIEGIDLSALTGLLASRIAAFNEKITVHAQALARHKVRDAHERLFAAYGNTREYVTLQQFQAGDLCLLSAALASFFAEKVETESIRSLWEPFCGASVVRVDCLGGRAFAGPVRALLDNGQAVEVIAKIAPDCHDRQILLPLLRLVRARWYATCANLLYSTELSHGGLNVAEKFPVIPLLAMRATDGDICLVQPVLAMPEGEYKVIPDYSLFAIPAPAKKAEVWRVHNDHLYLYDWSGVTDSHGGVYAYGHELSSEPIASQGPRSAIVSNIYTKFAQSQGADKVLVPVQLEEMLAEKRESMQYNYRVWQDEAARNGYMPADAAAPRAGRQGRAPAGPVRTKMYHVAPEQYAGIRWYVRWCATIDGFIKDLDADFACRRGNRDDFVADLRLTETITVPWLFGLFCGQPLFPSYDDVESIVSAPVR